MKRFCSIFLIFAILLTLIPSGFVLAADNVTLSLEVYGLNDLSDVLFQIETSGGKAYILSKGASVPLTPGEKITITTKIANSGLISKGLYIKSGGTQTKLSHTYAANYTVTVPSADFTLQAVYGVNDLYPVEFYGDNGHIKIDGAASEYQGRALVVPDDTVTVTGANGETVVCTAENALTGEVISNSVSFTMPEAPVRLNAELYTAVTFDGAGSVQSDTLDGNKVPCGETAVVNGPNGAEFMYVYGADNPNTPLDVASKNDNGTFSFVVPYRSAVKLAFNTESVTEIATEADLKSFAASVAVNPKQNARLTADIALSSPVYIPDFQGIFDGGNHTVSGNSVPLFAENKGVIFGVTVKSGAALRNEEGAFEPFDLAYTRQGTSASCLRFIVSKSNLPLSVISEEALSGLVVRGSITENSKTTAMESRILGIEDRGTELVLVVPETPEVLTANHSVSNSTDENVHFDLKVYPREAAAANSGIARQNSGYIFKCGNQTPVTGGVRAGGITAINKGVIRYSCNAGEISAPNAGGVAAENRGSIDFSYSSDENSAIVNTSQNGTVTHSYSVSDKYAPHAFRSGEIAELLNADGEVFGQTLNRDLFPVFKTQSNTLYKTKIIAGTITKTIYTNGSADKFNVYLSKYDGDRMTEIKDALQSDSFGIQAADVFDSKGHYDLSVTLNCNSDLLKDRRCMIINKDNIAPLSDTFYIEPITFGYTYIILTPELMRSNPGSWSYQGNTTGGNVSTMLQGSRDSKEHSLTPATKEIVIPTNGFYRIFAYSRDYASGTFEPGKRFFNVQIGDSISQVLGTHCQDGWAWQNSGFVPIFAGRQDLKLIDTSGYFARVGMIIVTDDPDFEAEDTSAFFTAMKAMAYDDSKYADFVTPAESTLNRPDSEYVIKHNGQYINFSAPVVMKDNVLLAPYDDFLTEFNCVSDYSEQSGTLHTTLNGKKITIYENTKSISVNDNLTRMNAAAEKINGKLYLPVSYIIEILGGSYKYDSDTKTGIILMSKLKSLYWFRPDSFSELGTWRYDSNAEGAFDSLTLIGRNDRKPANTKPAVAYFNADSSDSVWMWVRTRDYTTSYTGERVFKTRLNGELIDYTFGNHGTDGYQWVKLPYRVKLKKGENKLELVDTSAYWARCDSVLLTSDDAYIPSSSYSSLESLAEPVDSFTGTMDDFPAYTKQTPEASDSVTIENNKTKVVFYKVPTENGQIVQNEIFSLAPNGEWVKTNTRDEELGILVSRADSASVSTNQDMYAYNGTYTDKNGNERIYQGLLNPYLAGKSEWYIPYDYEVLGNNSVKLKFKDNAVSLSATWTVEKDQSAPLVTAEMKALSDGYYTMAGWEGKKLHFEDFSQAIAPFRVIEKQMYKHPVTITEQYLFTPMGCYTLEENNEYSAYPVTKGVVADSDWIPLRWVYGDNGILGINMISNGGGYKGSIFSPVMGSDESNLAAGDTYTMKYRVISSVSGWFENYKYILQDLFNVTDYRENTVTSLNEAIFNTRKLMLDDKYGGWDSLSKGHYNMEGKNTVSEANPMQAFQDYLITGDEKMLEKRVIPTIAAYLTRPSLHFNRVGISGGNNYWPVLTEPEPIGTPKTGYNLNVTGGLYEMTHGMIPYLYKLGLERGQKGVANEYGSVAPFSNNLNLYLYTGDESYLEKAKAQADEYLKTDVYKSGESIMSWNSFVYISNYPNLASMLDIYEVTKEQKYLDAAEYIGQQMLTGLWVPGVDNDKKNTQVEVNALGTFAYHAAEKSSGLWWAGDKQFRIGREGTALDDLTGNKPMNEKHGYVPSWQTSRVGLGLEQPSTFEGSSSNIIMQYWAADFVRLSQYTGEKAFETAARNAIIGRFGNYAGYYRTGFYTYEQYPEYPYTGPDYQSIYWHHIPPFLAMLESFLIDEASAWSNGNISFPSMRQQGYAYFNSRQYGHKPGKFFDEDNMWLWLDEDMIDTGNKQIDWVGARKDGVFSFAMLNESDKDILTEVSLLGKIPGGSTYTGDVTLYEANGASKIIQATNGKFTLRVPAKGLRAAKIYLPDVKAPSYTTETYALDGTADIGTTVSEHTNGKAYALQVTPENYYAYVYITDKPATVSKLTMTYSIGDGETQTLETTNYPFEFIVKVTDPNQPFNYTLSVDTTAGETNKSRGSGQIYSKTGYEAEKNAVSKTEVTAPYTGSHGSFTPFKLTVLRHGTNNMTNEFHLIVPKSSFPLDVSSTNSVAGLKVRGQFHADEKTVINMESVITRFEDRSSDWLFVIAGTPKVTTDKYSVSSNSCYFDLTLYPNGE